MSDQQTPPVAVLWRTEIGAGFTTFFTMAYILAVNPAILSASGMPAKDVFTATCVASALATALMGLWARYPFALAPGMGLNAFFAFTVCGALGVPWATALAGVLVSGVVFALLSLLGVRERLIAAVPPDLVRAIAAGIGLFIAFLGLEHAGITRGFVDDGGGLILALGDLTSGDTLIASLGLLLTAGLLAARVPGAILIAIVATAAAGLLTGLAPAPQSLVQWPSLPAETFGRALTALPQLVHPEMIVVVFTMLFIDLFDTMGTLLALGYRAGAIDGQGRLPRASRAFTADAFGTIAGALLGTSTVTTYIESSAGVVAGGRTGRTALVVAALFLLALPLAPLITAIPSFATAPALVVVGALMFVGVGEIRWSDPVVALPCLVTILAMPATYNISSGLGLGFVLWVATHLAAGRRRELPPLVPAIAGAFVLFFIFRVGG